MSLDQIQVLVLKGEMSEDHAWALGMLHHDITEGTAIRCWLIDLNEGKVQ